LFATEEFIQASRKFVCIRIETYENKQAEAMVRQLLNGRFANTAFCIFDPQGKQRLSRTGRSPSMALSAGRRHERSTTNDDSIVQQMNQVAAKYSATGRSEESALQDFYTFRQALNVASADQRLLIFINANNKDQATIASQLKPVLATEDIVGKFHVDFADADADKSWAESIQGNKNQPGIVIIRAGTFGQSGVVMNQLPVSATAEQVKTALLDANEKFARVEDRKTYRDHVTQGRRERIYFANEIPYGEDRDGDGKPDRRRGR
jgi:hypothetical protein